MSDKIKTFIFAVNGNSGDYPCEPTRKDIETILMELATNDVPTTLDEPQADKFGGGPVRDCYYLFVHPDVKESIKKCWGFVPIKDYPKFCNSVPNEFGAICNFRCIEDNDYSLKLPLPSRNENPIYRLIGTNLLSDYAMNCRVELLCTKG